MPTDVKTKDLIAEPLVALKREEATVDELWELLLDATGTLAAISGHGYLCQEYPERHNLECIREQNARLYDRQMEMLRSGALKPGRNDAVVRYLLTRPSRVRITKSRHPERQGGDASK